MNDNNILKTYFVLGISTIVIVLFAIFGSKLEVASIDNEDVMPYNEGWHYENADGEVINLTLPAKVDLPAGSTLRIWNTIPNNKIPGMTLSLWTYHQNIRIFIDNNQLFEFGFKQERLFGITNGSAFQFIRIPEGSAGKEIAIEFTSPYQSKIGELSKFTLGSKSADIFAIINQQGPQLFICFLTFIVGLIFLFIYIYMKLRFTGSKSLLHVALFSIVISIWSATETKVAQFFFPYQYLECIISYLSLMLFTVPFLFFLKEVSHRSKYNFFNILNTLVIANFILSNVLTFLKISDYRVLLPIVHILIVFSLIIAIYSVVKEVFYYKNKDAYALAIAIVILCFFAAIELIRFYFFNVMDSSILLRVGLLIFIVMIGLSSCNKLIIMIETGINTQVIHKLAYTDVLTGIKNRTAYMKDIDELNETLSPESNIIVMMFDVNNLKQVNDNMGHETGDTMIIGAANCIKNTFHDYGYCYRIGGDEFAVLIKDVADFSFQEKLSQLKQLVAIYNQENPIILEIPYGYTFYNDKLDKDIYTTFSRADQLMYQAKAQMKSQGQIDS